MTRDEAKQAIAILQAYVNGETIQFKCYDKWEDIYKIQGMCDLSNYRIKKEPRDFWMPILRGSHTFYTEKNARECCNFCEEVVHVREILE